MNELKLKGIGGGLKTIDFTAWGGIDNFLNATSTGSGGGGRSTLLRRVVPWLAKANNMTANAISDLPFDITRVGGDVYDSTDDWKNNLGGMPNPMRLIYLLASSLCGGRAYVIPTVTDSMITELHYCAPHTVSELITVNGLENFTRTSDFGAAGVYGPAGEEGEASEMMYFWLPDSDVELGPAKCHPMSTALKSTEMLFSTDSTLTGYAERGFIPPTILAAKGMPAQGEKEKLESKWAKFLSRFSDKPAMVVNADAIDIEQIGAGFGELGGSVYKDLTRQQIENIGASFGIPGALFMSDMAFASEFNAMIKFWYTTSEFIAVYHCIEETFNDQLLSRFKLKMQFKPETLDAFQEDEGERAGAFQIYTDAGLRPSIVADMLGLELPKGVESSALDENFDKPAPVPVIAPQMPQDGRNGNVPVDKPKKPVPEQLRKKDVQLDAQQIKDLDLWRQVAVRNHRKGKGNATDFECKSLPVSISDPIRARLEKADNELDVLKSFDILGDSRVEVFYDFTPILDAMRIELAGIKGVQPMNLTINNEPGKPAQVTVKAAESPVIHVAPTQVSAPAVNVTVTPSTATIQNTVNVPKNVPDVIVENKPRKVKVTRNPKGQIDGMEEK